VAESKRSDRLNTIQVEYREDVALVRLDRDVTNALNLQSIEELMESLINLGDDSEIRGIVLGSSNEKFFSIGLDIPQLMDLKEEDFLTFYRKFNRTCLKLYTLHKPTVAAVTGHAIAGGCILALCCDYRLIAEGRKLMGLNEVKLGVPVPYPADCMVRDLIGTRYAREVMYSGEFYEPEKLLQMGMVDETLALEKVIPASIRKARELGSFPEDAFKAIKRNRVEMVATKVLERLEEKEKLFVGLWYSEGTRRRLKEAIEKF
jgi:enoyl-CoA hydratase/carnithine racemase